MGDAPRQHAEAFKLLALELGLLGPAPIRDVRDRAHRAHDLALVVQDGIGGDDGPHLGAVLTLEAEVVLGVEALPAVGQVAPKGGNILLENELGHRAADHLRGGIPEHLRHAAIDEGRVPLRVHHHHAIAHHLHQAPESRLALPQGVGILAVARHFLRQFPGAGLDLGPDLRLTGQQGPHIAREEGGEGEAPGESAPGPPAG